MTRVEELKQAVKDLPPSELARFRRWFATFDNETWDSHIEADSASGKLNALTDKAGRAYEQEKTKEF